MKEQKSSLFAKKSTNELEDLNTNKVLNDDNLGQKKRASISNILNKGNGQGNDNIQSFNEAKNEEIINSLDSDSFYDKVLNNGEYDKAKKA